MGAKRRKGRAVKAAQKGSVSSEPEELSQAPHTFVISRGKLGKNTTELMLNFRKVMEPYTASRLKVQKKNVVKDYVSVAGLLHVTHMVVFTKTEQAIYLRIARLPRGPTLTFRVEDYVLAKDVLSSLKKKITYGHQYSSHPLLVLNNFSGEGMHLKLMTSMFQNMFPSINVNTVKLNTIRRCLLLNFNQEDSTIDFRHYTIKVAPCGINRAVKKLVQSRVPDLSRLHDVCEFLEQPGASESEAELEGTSNQVLLPQRIASRGNALNQQSSVRVVELGPRLTLKLVKVEEGLMGGEVMFHAFVKRSPEEVERLRERRLQLKKEKEKRKRQQEENRRRKEQAEREEATDEEGSEEQGEDEDRQWYREEVGEEPEDDLPPKAKKPRTTGVVRDKGGKMATGKMAAQKTRADKPVVGPSGQKGKKQESTGKRELSDFEVMMQRRKKRKKLKEKVKQQKLLTKKVSKLRAAQNQAPARKKKHRRTR
ncbi:putative protein Peter pan [Ixodes scapularis]